MNTNGDFDRYAAAWLADGPTELADRVLDQALAEVHLTRQRRALRVPWRFTHMPALTRATTVAAVVLVAAVGAGGFALLSSNDTQGPGGPLPSPTNSPSAVASPSGTGLAITTPTPTVNLDPASWTTFTSARYGYASKLPPGWQAVPATRAWTMARDRTDFFSPAQDQFTDPDATYQIGILGFAADVPPGMSADQWIDGFFEGTTPASGCLIPAGAMPAITVDGQTGKLADQQACNDTIAFVPIGDRIYVFTIGRENQVPLLRAFLSTVRFSPVAAPSPT